MKNITLGLLGFGTVGVGVVDGLRKNGALMTRRTGLRFTLGKIADLDWDTPRDITVDPSLTTTDSFSVVQDPGIDMVVELIGGTGVARELILAALDAGKPVVTANKALLARHGAELYRAAARNNVDLCFEASTGGCIPIVRAIREDLIANRFTALYGILNGTCNYILTRMEEEQAAFEDVLREAQALGYAEAEPSLDIDGHDTAHKATLLASLIHEAPVALDSVPVQGIRGLSPEDIRLAGELGYRIKLLAQIECDNGAVHAAVHPALIPRHSLLAQVSGPFNAVMVKTDMADTTLYVGRGAGRNPTASAVLSDVADVARNLACGCPRRVPGLDGEQAAVAVKALAQTKTKHYIRVSHALADTCPDPVLTCLENAGLNIEFSVTRPLLSGQAAATAIVASPATEDQARAGVARLKALQARYEQPVWMSIQEGL